MILEVEFAIFKSEGFLIGGGLAFALPKKKIAIPKAATAAIVAKTIATIAPADNPLFLIFL